MTTLTRHLATGSAAVAPCDGHFEICSPWRRLGYEEQLARKRQRLLELYDQGAGEAVPVEDFRGSPERFGYRTKMEFGFTQDGDDTQDGDAGAVQIAFHKRGRRYEMQPLPHGCALAGDGANAAALAVVDRLNDAGVPARALKSLVTREARRTGDVVAVLYVKSEEFAGDLLSGLGGVSGAAVIYSRPDTPASVTTRVLGVEGRVDLVDEVAGLRLRYPHDGFFQNNIPVFERALADIAARITTTGMILELYSGVGAIGLSLHDRAQRVVGFELDAGAVACARANATHNGISNYETVTLSAQQIHPATLAAADVLVMDPPREGLAPKIVRRIANARPPQIVYLSCNPATQARDYALLQEVYQPVSLGGYDFFPNTPHIESLLVLEAR